MATTIDSPKLNFMEIVHSISQKEFDLEYYSSQVIENENLRDEIVLLMRRNPDIMVYYHCFYVIEKACQKNPELFYKYFLIFRELINHPNSYHRDFGLILIAMLAGVDEKNLMIDVLDEYLQHVCDPKFMTARCCIQNCSRIIHTRPELTNRILPVLFDKLKQTPYSESQKALLEFDLLEILEKNNSDFDLNNKFGQFILHVSTGKSPKARKKAKEIIARYK